MQRILIVLFLTTSRSATAGGFYLPLGGGQYLVIDDVLILTMFTIVAGTLFYYGLSWLGSSFNGPPPTPPSCEDYDDQAAQYRAKARMLEAQAAYDDSRAKAALKKAEFDEVEKFLK
jgi:hypothetical protein